MLIFHNLFVKSFWKRRKKFKSYLILILIFIMSLLFLFQFNKKINNYINKSESNLNLKKIVVTNLEPNLGIDYLNSIDEISKVYKIYDSLNINVPFNCMQVAYYIDDEYENLIINGRGIKNNTLEVIVPNYLYVNDNMIYLSKYYDTEISIPYIDRYKNEAKVNVKVVGIYDNSLQYNVIFASQFFFENLDIDVYVSKYMVIVDKISNIDKTLETLNEKSNSYVYNMSEYNVSKNVLLVCNIFEFVFIFITIVLCLIFFNLSNNLIYDLKNDIAILRSYGYSSIYILKNISLLLLLIFLGCYLFLIIIVFLLIKINILSNFLSDITFNDYFKVLLICLINILFSFFISIVSFRNKTIKSLLIKN